MKPEESWIDDGIAESGFWNEDGVNKPRNSFSLLTLFLIVLCICGEILLLVKSIGRDSRSDNESISKPIQTEMELSSASDAGRLVIVNLCDGHVCNQLKARVIGAHPTPTGGFGTAIEIDQADLRKLSTDNPVITVQIGSAAFDGLGLERFSRTDTAWFTVDCWPLPEE